MALFLTAVANVLKSAAIKTAINITQTKSLLQLFKSGKSISTMFKSFLEFKKSGKGGLIKFVSIKLGLWLKQMFYDRTALNHQKTIFYKWAQYQKRKYEYWEEAKHGFVPPNFKYDFFLKNYAYKFGLLGKIWKEYERLLRKLENDWWKAMQDLHAVYANERIKEGWRQFRAQKKWAEAGGKLDTLKKQQQKILKWLDKYFELEREENKPFFNWYQNANKSSYKTAFHMLVKEEKLKANVNMLTQDITNFSEWFDSLNEEDKQLVNKNMYESTQTQLSWNSSWIRSSAFVPITEILAPKAEFQFKPYKSSLMYAMHPESINYAAQNNLYDIDKIITQTLKLNKHQRMKRVVNTKTRGFMHIWIDGKWVVRDGLKVKVPRSKKNPTGHYIWFNVPWKIYKKLEQERTGKAFWKYFYYKYKFSMDYLTNKSIYWDTTRQTEKKHYNKLKRKNKKAKK